MVASGEVIHSFFYSLITEIVIASEGIVFIGRNLAEIIHKLLHLYSPALSSDKEGEAGQASPGNRGG